MSVEYLEPEGPEVVVADHVYDETHNALTILRSAIDCPQLTRGEARIVADFDPPDRVRHLAATLMLHCDKQTNGVVSLVGHRQAVADRPVLAGSGPLRSGVRKAKLRTVDDIIEKTSGPAGFYQALVEDVRRYENEYQKHYMRGERPNLEALEALYDQTDQPHPILDRLSNLPRNGILREAHIPTERLVRFALLKAFGTLTVAR